MRILIATLIAAGFGLASNPALARPDTRSMTCAQAQNLVKNQGSAVLTTGQRTFSLFVTRQSSCDYRERLQRQFAPTADNPRCPVAYQCVEPMFRHGEIFSND